MAVQIQRHNTVEDLGLWGNSKKEAKVSEQDQNRADEENPPALGMLVLGHQWYD